MGDARRAETLYSLLLPYDGLNVIAGAAIACYGAVSRFLGMLAATMSRWEDAERHFKDALELNQRMGARPYVAHTQHRYAEMLLARRGPGDPQKAQGLLGRINRHRLLERSLV